MTLRWAAAETVGLGGPLTGDLWTALARRPYDRGGGVRHVGPVMVEEQPDGTSRMVRWDGRRFVPARPQRRSTAVAPTLKVEAPTTAGMKTAMYTASRLMMERGWLAIPRAAEDLVRELSMIVAELNDQGGYRIQARSGHDDCADSLALSLCPERVQGGWMVRALTLARRLDARAERDDRPLAERVPTRPRWRSIEGEDPPERSAVEDKSHTEFVGARAALRHAMNSTTTEDQHV